MSALHIREAMREDLPSMLQLYAQPNYDDGAVLPLDDARRLFDEVASYPFYKFFVALQDEVVVGTYAILVMVNIGHLGAPSAVVESVAVDPEWQGGGVGRAMMDHAMEIARQHGCYKVALSSSVKRTRAHAFYENLGYRRYGYCFGVDLYQGAAP
ncbi:MAG: GNAT family N-acetyltransferase [Beijerinckiaceae bacterium]